jgi:hypothetical protein
MVGPGDLRRRVTRRADGRFARVATPRARRRGAKALDVLAAPLTRVELEVIRLIDVVEASGAIAGATLVAALPEQLVLLPLSELSRAAPDDGEARDEQAASDDDEAPQEGETVPRVLVLPSSALVRLDVGRRGAVRVVLQLPDDEAIVLDARSRRLADVLPRPQRQTTSLRQPGVHRLPAPRAGEGRLAVAPAPAPATAATPDLAEPGTTAIVVTPLDPCGYVELDGCLKPARWDAPGASPPAVGERVAVEHVDGRTELSAGAAVGAVID